GSSRARSTAPRGGLSAPFNRVRSSRPTPIDLIDSNRNAFRRTGDPGHVHSRAFGRHRSKAGFHSGYSVRLMPIFEAFFVVHSQEQAVPRRLLPHVGRVGSAKTPARPLESLVSGHFRRSRIGISRTQQVSNFRPLV